MSRHVRVEPHASDVHEEAAVELADIDASIAGVEGVKQRSIRIAREPKHARQAVARSGGDHTERRRAERERRRNLVDGSVPTPGNDYACPAIDGTEGKVACMAATLGDENFRIDAGVREDLVRALGTASCPLESASNAG